MKIAQTIALENSTREMINDLLQDEEIRKKIIRIAKIIPKYDEPELDFYAMLKKQKKAYLYFDEMLTKIIETMDIEFNIKEDEQ